VSAYLTTYDAEALKEAVGGRYLRAPPAVSENYLIINFPIEATHPTALYLQEVEDI
jgi:hypothetical protein